MSDQQSATTSARSTRRDLSTAQLTLIRRSVARTCTDPEFDEFMAVAFQCGLDPMRRQITPLVLNAADPNRRRLVSWATIDGLRVIAARQGDYRPMEAAPLIEVDEARIDADRNPLGIVRAEVRAWKHRDGEWFPVVGEVWWDEYAPLREVFASDANGRRQATGKWLLEPSWARMGRVMIVKCAEAQALRRGWPDLLSGLYGEEELHALRLADQTASGLLNQRDRLKVACAENTLWMVFDPHAGLQAINRSDVAGRIRAFYETEVSAEALAAFHDRNRTSLQIFWDWEPSAAFELKQLAEARLRALQQSTCKRKRRDQAPAARPRRGAKAHADADSAGEPS